MSNESVPPNLHQQIHQLTQRGEFKQALAMNQQWLQQNPTDHAAWINQSTLLFQAGDVNGILEAIEQAIVLQPDNWPYRVHQIMAMEALGHLEVAIETAAGLADQAISDLSVLEHLAAFLNKHQQFQAARKLYQQAVEKHPKNVQMWLNLAMTEQYLGDLDAAESAVNQALTLAPHDCDAHFFRSHLRRQSPENNHIKALQQTMQLPIHGAEKQAKGWFALAKELEDCSRFEESFSARQTGAKIYRNSFQYDLNSDLAFMQALRTHYDQQRLHQPASGFATDEPIFIVGLPRSGTTLLERIIGSHSEVKSAGELTHFNRNMLAAMNQLQLNPQLSRAEMVAASVHLDFKALGQNYLNSTRPLTGSTAHFIDKFPQNAHYVGLIHRALPQAKILILERHPLDVCYAVYKQMFTDIYHFSYDLDELAAYYIEHQKLMDHWQSSLPEAVKTIRYEDIVEDLEGQARAVIDFCGLDWQDACLNFHQNQQASTTASASQVRQKLYSSSVGLWQNYAQQLKPLRDRLEQAGCLEGWQNNNHEEQQR